MLDSLYNLLTDINTKIIIDINTKIIICVVVFLFAALNLPNWDKRFKTGYKDNKKPGAFRGCLIPLIMIISFLVGVFYLIQRFISKLPG